jgi:hypothetical protein
MRLFFCGKGADGPIRHRRMERQLMIVIGHFRDTDEANMTEMEFSGK